MPVAYLQLESSLSDNDIEELDMLLEHLKTASLRLIDTGQHADYGVSLFVPPSKDGYLCNEIEVSDGHGSSGHINEYVKKEGLKIPSQHTPVIYRRIRYHIFVRKEAS